MEKTAAGAGADVERKPTYEHFRNAIRYILNLGRRVKSTGDVVYVTFDDFLPSIDFQEKILYRGQCSATTKFISVRGSNPLEISLDLEPVRPISASEMLTTKVEEYACYKGEQESSAAGAAKAVGRIFEIHLQPNIPYVSLGAQIPEDFENTEELLRDTFGVVQEEMDPESFWKGKSLVHLYGAFFSFLSKEREVLLDPRKIQFVKEDLATAETWEGALTARPSFFLNSRGKLKFVNKKNKDLVPPPNWKAHPEKYIFHGIPVYVTYAISKASGGRRKRNKTLRRKRSGTKKRKA
jgi:hypothetical protein